MRSMLRPSLNTGSVRSHSLAQFWHDPGTLRRGRVDGGNTGSMTAIMNIIQSSSSSHGGRLVDGAVGTSVTGIEGRLVGDSVDSAESEMLGLAVASPSVGDIGAEVGVCVNGVVVG